MTEAGNIDSIESNGEIFTYCSYNSINIIQRNSDKYVNATKLCSQFNRVFRKIYDTKSWKEFYDEFQKNVSRPKKDGFIYEIKTGFKIELHGTYIHPKLINFVSFWASPKYAFIVSHIMDMINEELHIRNITLDQKINELEENLKDLNLPKPITIGTIRIHKLLKIDENFRYRNKNYDKSNCILENSSLYKVYCADTKRDIIDEKDICIDITRAKDTWNYMKKLVKDNVFDFIYKYPNSIEIYEINDLDKFLETISSAKNNNISIETECNIEILIKNTIERWSQSNPKLRTLIEGKLYEYYSLKKLSNNIYLWNYLPMEFLNSINHTRNDTGIDMVDIENKILYQCKYYPNMVIPHSTLKSFYQECENIRFITNDDSWKSILVCLNSSKLEDKDILYIDEIYRYDADDMLNDLNKIPINIEYNKKNLINDIVIENWNLTDSEISKIFYEQYQIEYNVRYIHDKRKQISFLHSELPKIENIFDIYNTAEDIIMKNWELSNDEIFDILKQKINKNFFSDYVQSKRRKICKKYPNFIMPKNKFGKSQDIIKFIKDNWNLPNTELKSLVNKRFDKTYDTDYINEKRHIMKDKYPNLALPINQIQQSNLVNEFIKSHWDLTNEEILNLIQKELKLNYRSVDHINYKRRQIAKEDSNFKYMSIYDSAKLTLDYIYRHWNLSNEELRKNIKKEFNISLGSSVIYQKRYTIIRDIDPTLKLPEKIQNKDVMIETIKNNWDLSNEELLKLLNQNNFNITSNILHTKRIYISSQYGLEYKEYKTIRKCDYKIIRYIVKNNWNLSNEELLELINKQYNFTLEQIKTQRATISKNNPIEYPSNYNNHKIINNFIMIHINDDRATILEMINKKFNINMTRRELKGKIHTIKNQINRINNT